MKFNNRQWLILGGIVVLLLLVLNLNSRLIELGRVSAERDKMRTEVAVYTATISALETQIAYANSPKAVEEWLRVYKHQVREGEIPIVPQVQTGDSVQPTVTPAPTSTPIPNWMIWKALFFEDYSSTTVR